MKISHSGFNVMKITVKWMKEGREGGRGKEGRRVSIFFIRLPSSRISLGPDKYKGGLKYGSQVQ